ncbi:hypothetical protein LCGC14_3126340, partial [marine sediment metagenome]
HWETGIHSVNGTMFAGPGAVSRTSRSESEVKRQPMAYVVELERGKEVSITKRTLESVRPAEEVFARQEEKAGADGSLFAGYVAALETGMNLEGLSVEEAVRALDLVESGIIARKTYRELPQSAVDLVVQVANSEHKRVAGDFTAKAKIRRETADAAEAKGDLAKYIPQLVGALAHSEKKVKVYAAQCIRNVGSAAREGVPALIELLDETDEKVVIAALKALAALGKHAKAAAQRIDKLTGHDSFRIVGAAEDALKAIK